MLRKDNQKIRFSQFEQTFDVEKVKNIYLGISEYQGKPANTLFLKCTNGLYQLVIEKGFQIYDSNIILGMFKTGYEIKFENYDQYDKLVKLINQKIQNK